MAKVYKLPLHRERLTVAVCTTDTHVPFHDVRAHKSVCRYVQDLRPDYWIDLGDFVDYYEISRHVGKAIRTITGQTLAKTNAKAREVLQDRLTALGAGRYVQIEGNHDKRPEDVMDEHPQLEGLLEIENALEFERHGITYIRNWSSGDMAKLGHAYMGHGRYTNDHHAKKHVDRYGKNYLYGHTHDIQSYSKVWEGDGETRIGQSIGCMCRYDLDYKKGDPDRWQQAVTTLYVRPNGLFSYFISSIFDGAFIAPNGKLYEPTRTST